MKGETMPQRYTQSNRPLQLTTPLGEDVLLVQGFSAREAISSPFQFDLDLVSIEARISFRELLGKPVCISLLKADGFTRYFHGRVSRFVQGPANAEGMSSYRAEVVPWLWFLTLSSDCRIFQNMSAQEIITQIFHDFQFDDFEFRSLSGGQHVREYCVQYRESAFNFVSRLLEEEGIFYFFEHGANRHLLVLADSPVEHPPCEGQIEARIETGSSMADQDSIQEVNWTQEVRPGKVTLEDFNFVVPGSELKVDLSSAGKYEIYDYPGLYENWARGDALARLRLEAHDAALSRLVGSSTCRPFCPGFRFNLLNFYRTDVETAQVLLSVHHQARQSVSPMHEGQSSGFSYRNTFTSFSYNVPFRPPQTARKPCVSGTQTAIVVGKSGEEIWTDSYGRVTVQFHWDRRGQMNEKSSCWVRVAHNWAGRNWGTFFVPRIGQEVLVDFLEGDPDRPIIVGGVYNGDQMPPYALPEHQTRSTIKSNSTKGGNGYNELRYEDRKGSEEVFLHAQKDFNEVVENNHMTTVHGNQTNTVDGFLAETVGKNVTGIYKQNQTTTVTGNVKESYKGSQSTEVTQSVTESYHSSLTTTVDAGLKVDVTGGEKHTVVSGGLNLTVTGPTTQIYNTGLTQTITGSVSQTVNGATTRLHNGPQSVVVTGPSTQVCSSGTNHVDPTSYWKLTGCAGELAKVKVTIVVGAKIDITSALALTMTNLKVDMSLCKIDLCKKVIKNNPSVFELTPNYVRSGIFAMYLGAMTIFM